MHNNKEQCHGHTHGANANSQHLMISCSVVFKARDGDTVWVQLQYGQSQRIFFRLFDYYWYIKIEKCSLEFYNVLPIWVGDVYHLDNSFIEIYNFLFVQLETERILVSDSPISFLLAERDAKPEQTR